MEELPDLALERILEFLPFGTRKTCRSVCKKWQNQLEENEKLGLSLRLDDSAGDGNFDFAQSVVVKEANLVQLRRSQDLRLLGTTSLILTGYANPAFVATNLLRAPRWQHLSKLYFSGTFLLSQDLGTAGDEPRPCHFPHLSQLHLSLAARTQSRVMGGIYDGVQEDRILLPRNRTATHVRDLIEERVQRNLNYLLGSIRSSRLARFLYSVGWNRFSKLRMEPEPVYKFIDQHASTLKELILPSLAYEEWERKLDGNRRLVPKDRTPRSCTAFPEALKSVYVSMIHDQDPAGRFWNQLIESQAQLEEVFLEYESFPWAGLDSFLSNLSIQNFNSLNYLCITSFDTKAIVGSSLTIDLSTFSICHNLSTLILNLRGSHRKPYPHRPYIPDRRELERGGYNIPPKVNYPKALTLKNTNQLPSSLKVFETTLRTAKDFDGLLFLNQMTKLEELWLGSMEAPKDPRRMGEFVLAAFRHRRLNSFSVELAYTETDPPYAGGSWTDIRPIKLRPKDLSFVEKLLDGSEDWLVQSMHLSGLHPSRNQALMIYGPTDTDIKDKSYYRHFFDALHTGCVISEQEMDQPYFIHRQAEQAYEIAENDDDRDPHGSRPVSLMPTQGDYFDVYNSTPVDKQAVVRATILSHIGRISEYKKTIDPQEVDHDNEALESESVKVGEAVPSPTPSEQDGAGEDEASEDEDTDWDEDAEEGGYAESDEDVLEAGYAESDADALEAGYPEGDEDAEESGDTESDEEGFGFLSLTVLPQKPVKEDEIVEGDTRPRLFDSLPGFSMAAFEDSVLQIID